MRHCLVCVIAVVIVPSVADVEINDVREDFVACIPETWRDTECGASSFYLVLKMGDLDLSGVLLSHNTLKHFLPVRTRNPVPLPGIGYQPSPVNEF